MPSSQKLSLEAGLVALKQGNHYAAITHLVPVANSRNQSNTCLQAQVGLVMAYAHTGEISEAIAWCHNLMKSDNPQVQDWAKRALEHLIKRQKRLQSKNITNYTTTVQHSTTISKNHRSQTDLLNSHFHISGDSTTTESNTIYWRQARRKDKFLASRLLALVTFIALVCVLEAIFQSVMVLTNQILDKLPYVNPLPFLYTNPSLLILVLLLVLSGLSPWLLDWLLARYYQQQPLSKETLYNYSREAVRVTQRTCQMRRWAVPKLQILPIAAPLMFTYGNLPRTARIVVSQGLLEQLNDDEIATIYAFALGQIRRWDFWIMSLACLVTLPIYQLYQQASTWGNKSENQICITIATAIASLSYGVWCILSSTTLLNSRFRLYASDRQAAEITGNPNGLIRALLKITIGIANDIQQKEQTSFYLESLNILAPVDFKQSICIGSIAGNLPWESFFTWEYSNPYRRWFTINHSHPLMGDRLQRLCQIARHWHLEPEIYFIHPEILQVKPQSFLLQIAPWLGIPLGFVLAGLFWFSWQTAYNTHIFNLKWIYDDLSFVVGFLMIGFSIGTLMRVNPFFPEIKAFNPQSEQQIFQLLTNPSVLPIDSVSIRIVGKLLGRRGTGNSLCQDLILETKTGLIKLHHIPWLTPSATLQQWIGRQITVTGWLRRGATPWIDIQTLETQSGITINSPHPIWSTVLAVVTQAWGAYIMLTAQSLSGS
jgi:Zn-dependent protease with chaperone function